jgi:4'-phosphopantetheinyl transferase
MNQAFIQPWQFLQPDALADNTVLHLLAWEYPSPTHSVFRWNTWLDKAEQQRAEGIPHAIRRYQFLIARAVLRWCLAQSLGQGPAQLQFGYDNKAKPFLKGESKLFFNLSHSCDIGLLALWSGGEVGVDVEKHNHLIRTQVLKRIAHPLESEAILASAGSLRDQASLRLWVRKEAVAKVQGQGIFRVRQLPCLPIASLFHDCVQPLSLKQLQLIDIPGLPTAAAALAWEGTVNRVCMWQLELSQLS